MNRTTSSESVGAGSADVYRHMHTGSADAYTVAAFRRTFGGWLGTYLELDEERIADIVLATDEAMSNCVDHAYRVVDHTGSMTLQIAYFPVTSELRVCISDNGRWREPSPAPRNIRGRGILLMRALADDCTIDGGLDGTTVCLRFHDCPPNDFVLSHAS